MKIGLQIPSFTFKGGLKELSCKLAEIARVADEAGFLQHLGHGSLLPDRQPRSFQFPRSGGR